MAMKRTVFFLLIKSILPFSTFDFASQNISRTPYARFMLLCIIIVVVEGADDLI